VPVDVPLLGGRPDTRCPIAEDRHPLPSKERLPVPVILKGGNMGREQLAELVSFTTLASQ
jgi:hypothetical protein